MREDMLAGKEVSAVGDGGGNGGEGVQLNHWRSWDKGVCHGQGEGEGVCLGKETNKQK